MTDSELKRLYKTACDAKGFEPNDGQFRIWKQTLGWSEKQDLEAAIAEYYQTSLTFPMPVQLRELVGRIERSRKASASESRYLVVFLCPVCNVRSSGFLAAGASTERACVSSCGPALPANAPVGTKRPMLKPGERCGASLRVVHDERPKGWAA